MTGAQQHVVRRELLDVSVAGSEADGLAAQRALARVSREPLWAALDELFSRVAPRDRHWRLDRLEVDVGTLSLECIERDLVGATVLAAEKQLRECATQADDPRQLDRSAARATGRGANGSEAAIEGRTEAQAVHDALVYFLEFGALPWWFQLPAEKTLEQTLADCLRAGAPLAPRLANVLAIADARVRLVRQFSVPLLEELLGQVAPTAADLVRDVRCELRRHELTTEQEVELARSSLLAAFTLVATRQPATMERLLREWRGVVAAPGGELRDVAESARARLAPEAPRAAPRERDLPREPRESARAAAPATSSSSDPLARELDLAEGLFVDCAGLVLLHPFLPALFERLDLSVDDVLLQPDRALSLLHFLATGQTPAPEYALLLPKLLCGRPLEQPVGLPVVLSERERAEAEQLLAVVIAHWDALGGASADALRGTFLSRPGKLSRRDDAYLLQIEPQSFDVLLDRLPWGVGAIRLPWMEKLLWVEWRM